MRHIKLQIAIIVVIALSSCHSTISGSSAIYKWEHHKNESKYGDTRMAVLNRNNKRLYAYIDSPVIGVTHMFSDGEKPLFSISDGTGKDILGSGVSVNNKIKSNVDMLDLDMDGDIDFVMYGDQYFGRYKDNRFAPLSENDIPKVHDKQSVLEYLRTKNSEQ